MISKPELGIRKRSFRGVQKEYQIWLSRSLTRRFRNSRHSHRIMEQSSIDAME
ncbi:hypothetical protein Sjap_016879 [Stephania japonica]|uniref:Uncharacterized protein n=1 Tax=Stephania japonica TaxID=461633 RepID=A0AAP0NJ70_9MAGN